MGVQGLTASEIGVRLGITKNAVLGKARGASVFRRGTANHSDPWRGGRHQAREQRRSARLASNDQRREGGTADIRPARHGAVTIRDMRSRSSRHWPTVRQPATCSRPASGAPVDPDHEREMSVATLVRQRRDRRRRRPGRTLGGPLGALRAASRICFGTAAAHPPNNKELLPVTTQFILIEAVIPATDDYQADHGYHGRAKTDDRGA